MNREYHKWWSPRLQKDMELLVFGHSGAKVLVFPTRGGHFYEYENLGLVDSLKHKIDAGELQLYCVDSIDSESFYCFWAHPEGRVQRYTDYENYILYEVMPLMHQMNPHPCVISHGCSLGAYFAANIAFRHPDHFQKLVAFSGRYDLTTKVECFDDLLDGYYSDSVYFHTPNHFLAQLHDEHQLNSLRALDIVFVIGNEDPFKESNHILSNILDEKGISHQLHHWDGRAHKGSAWRQMAPHFV